MKTRGDMLGRRQDLIARLVGFDRRLKSNGLTWQERVADGRARDAARDELAQVERELAGDEVFCADCGCMRFEADRATPCAVCAGEKQPDVLSAELAAARLETAAAGVIADAVATVAGAPDPAPVPCTDGCPGWAVFRSGAAFEIQQCDECWGDEGPGDDHFQGNAVCQAALAVANVIGEACPTCGCEMTDVSPAGEAEEFRCLSCDAVARNARRQARAVSEREVAHTLIALLGEDDASAEAAREFLMQLSGAGGPEAEAYADAGIMTTDEGLELRLNGARFHITIKRSR